MSEEQEERLDPEALLNIAQQEEQKKRSGKLRVFFGMSAGVGKTYAMLEAAQQFKKEGGNVLIGTVNTHGRKETARLLEGLEEVPEKWINYKETVFEELDLDEILRRRPQLVLIDELAHSNVPGSRHPKRWQDVLEILDAGIDVYTTLNVQHLESRKEIVEGITRIPIRETVPDLILERASQIELIDLPPPELLKRLNEGKVYLGNQSQIAAQNFFQEDRLTALREIALRMTAEKVDHDLQGMLTAKDTSTAWKATERVLVPITAAPESQQIIRAARRFAYTQNAPWIVLYVDTGESLTEEQRGSLAKNLELASELGAEAITTIDTDLEKAVLRIAKQKHITQIVLPKNRSSSWNLIKDSLLAQLIESSTDIDIHLIRQDAPQAASISSGLKQALASKFSSYWLTFCFLFLFTGFNYMLLPAIGYFTSGVLFLLAILSLSAFVGRGPTFFAAIYCALAWNFFFIPPESNQLQDRDILFLFASFFMAALITGSLSAKNRQHEQMMRLREEKTQALYDIMGLMIRAKTMEELTEAVSNRLSLILNGQCSIAVKAGDANLTSSAACDYLKQPKEYAVAIWALKNGKSAGWSTDTLPSVDNLFVPLKGYHEIIGILSYKPKLPMRKLLIEEVNLLYTIAQQLAIFIERAQYEERERHNEYVKQVEKIHQAILNSVAYEFRAPMNEIMQSSVILKDNRSNQDELHFATEKIEEEIKSLSRIVDNVLEMSRLSSGFLTIKKEKHRLTDFFHLIRQNIAKVLGDHQLKISIPQDIPPLSFDANLLEIVFTNLLLNAAAYSPPKSTIELHAELKENMVIISVADEGPGIPPQFVEKVFEKFYRVPGNPMSGSGLGLSIAKAIIEMHSGKIEARNRKKIGAEFIVSLPIQESS